MVQASMDVDAMKCGNEFGQTKFTSVCREIIKRFINQHFPTCKVRCDLLLRHF